MLDLRDETYREIRDIKDFSTGQLSIGVSHTRGRVILPEILPYYQDLYPGIELKLVEGNSKELAADLLHGDIDLVIDLLPLSVENVETVPICKEEILLVVPDQVLETAFPGRLDEIRRRLSKSVDLSLLENCPFVLLKKGEPGPHHCRRDFHRSPDHAENRAGNGKHRNRNGLKPPGHGHYLLPENVHVRGNPSDQQREAFLKKSRLNLYSLDYDRAHGGAWNRLSQKPLYLPGHKGIYPHRQRKNSLQPLTEGCFFCYILSK